MHALEKVGRREWRFVEPECIRQTMDDFHHALDLWEDGHPAKAERMLRAVIDNCPQHIDALHHLALILGQKGRVLEAYLMAKEAADIGLKALDDRFDMIRDKLEWGWLENRPFLRAYHWLGLIHQQRKEFEKASEIYGHILSMNPNDNQGIRCLMVETFFELRQPEKVLAVCDQYKGDVLAETLYGRPLAMIELGHREDAIQPLSLAVASLPLVAQELLRKRHVRPRSTLPGTIAHGGADQAYEYWLRSGRFWSRTDGALSTLAEIMAETTPSARKIPSAKTR